MLDDDNAVDHPDGVQAGRYEVPIATGIAFDAGPDVDWLPIQFEGRRFLWHRAPRDPDSDETWPTVTTVYPVDPEPAQDWWEDVHRAMERFLSALSYHYKAAITTRAVRGTGVGKAFSREFSPPRAVWARGMVPGMTHPVLSELLTVADERLHIVMGYWRDGCSTGSPFFRFLAFWNALDIACENVDMPTWVRAQSKAMADRIEGQPADLWLHLHDERRHAVAHAVREPDKPDDLDPNDPSMRMRFDMDSRVLATLVRQRVNERWGLDATQDVP